MLNMTPLPMAFSEMHKQFLYRNVAEDIMCWWFDQYMLAFVKMWYFPNFVAGSADNIVDLFKPQTYNICKI